MALLSLFSNLPWIGASSKLCSACAEGDLKSVKELATAQIVNEVGWMGWAPLHKGVMILDDVYDEIASQSGHAEVVEYLLMQSELKADVNIRDTDNHTPLILACGVTKANTTDALIKVVHLLLAGGASVNAEDDGGYTALDLAVINNNIEAVKLLLEYKCNVNHQNQDSFTPLHSACRYHFQEIASLLVSAGADLSIADGQGRTPIQLAQRYGVVLSLSSPQATHTSASPSTSTATPSSAPIAPVLPPSGDTAPKTNADPHKTLFTVAHQRSVIGGRAAASQPASEESTRALQAELEAEIEASQATPHPETETPSIQPESTSIESAKPESETSAPVVSEPSSTAPEDAPSS